MATLVTDNENDSEESFEILSSETVDNEDKAEKKESLNENENEVIKKEDNENVLSVNTKERQNRTNEVDLVVIDKFIQELIQENLFLREVINQLIKTKSKKRIQYLLWLDPLLTDDESDKEEQTTPEKENLDDSVSSSMKTDENESILASSARKRETEAKCEHAEEQLQLDDTKTYYYNEKDNIFLSVVLWTFGFLVFLFVSVSLEYYINTGRL